jgi:hypothetical protein
MNQVEKAIKKMPAWRIGTSLTFEDFIFRQIITLPLMATSTGAASRLGQIRLEMFPFVRHLDCVHWWMT